MKANELTIKVKLYLKRHGILNENFTISFSNSGKTENKLEFKFDKF